MKNLKLFIIVLVTALFNSCTGVNYGRYDGMILVEPKSGKRFLLSHSTGVSYLVYREVEEVVDGDTMRVFR